MAQAADGTEAIGYTSTPSHPLRHSMSSILDLTVPGGMGGIETLRAQREIDPQVRAIVSSGYSTDARCRTWKRMVFAAVVPKPYQPEQLRQAPFTP